MYFKMDRLNSFFCVNFILGMFELFVIAVLLDILLRDIVNGA